ncbi:serine/threonine protein kinase [Luminiphilus syltensis NOR5-1B]|uniref:Ion-translocating oxidoreductase complex subunit C n=1 Tax=Luminiphilus syltensis NOR5-1B TaxID=565045 RepID=B8KQD8_9GAMM|nr:electron transport complex subunit RsxC [Luminiphilus syltensis]EED36504.1 serine/threonine protein kinase [Luminiphilus syltensis NOR5-1B]
MRKIHDIHGGIHPPERKALSRPGELQTPPMPGRLVLPLSQHIGKPAQPVVAVGDQVLGGQLIAEAEGPVSVPVHAPTSGTITAVDRFAIPHASGLEDCCVEIAPDGTDRWVELNGIDDYRAFEPSELVSLARNAGIAGMGGAGFPTAVKLMAREGRSIDTVIINGTECEPYITADDTIMQCQPREIVLGAQMLAYIVGAEHIVIGVEDNKPTAFAAMRDAASGIDNRIEVVSFPTKYPSGGEKQLIEILTGKQVPSGGLPSDIGILCNNPGTAVAIYEAIANGRPLTRRIVTLTGEALQNPGNFEAMLGTPISHLLDAAGYRAEQNNRLIHGGPMMGFALHSADIPIIKTTNCILAPTEQELPTPAPAQPCIRCGMCAEACPAELLPQQLYWFARAKDNDSLEQHNLFDCIECGACSWVCPSQIPLVQYYRAGKAAINEARQEKVRSDRSRARFEARQERVEREAAEREAKRAQRKAAAQRKAEGSDGEDPVKAAIARAKARKQAEESTE